MNLKGGKKLRKGTEKVGRECGRVAAEWEGHFTMHIDRLCNLQLEHGEQSWDLRKDFGNTTDSLKMNKWLRKVLGRN